MGQNTLWVSIFAIVVLSLNPTTYLTPYWMKILNMYTVKLTWYYITVLHFIIGFNFEIYLFYTVYYFLIYYASDLLLKISDIDISGHVYITLLGYTSLLHINKTIANVFLLCWSICMSWTLINFHIWEEKYIAACLALLFYCNMYERYPHK